MLPRRLQLDQFGEVDALLRRLGTDVRSTRKGHHWEVVVGGSVFFVSHQDTSECVYDYKDDLLEHQMDFENVPEAFVIAAPTTAEIDQLNLKRLQTELASLFGGLVFEGRG